jgi:uncharacterized protein (DUF1499 family)
MNHRRETTTHCRRSRLFNRGLGGVGAMLLLTACVSGPKVSGVSEGYLKPCPPTPNCVGTLESGDQRVEPLILAVKPEQAVEDLARALGALPRVKIAEQDDRYLRAEFTSLLMRFVDDVEFHVQKNGNLAVRSASRVGYSDLGANRRRVEELRVLFRERGIIR